MNTASQPPSRRKWIIHAAALAIVCLLILGTALTDGPPSEDAVPAAYGTALALLPPAVAIALALITKEVYSSLFVGIAVGAFLWSGGNPEGALNTMLYHPDAGLVVNLTDLSHASILVFVTLLGTLVVLLNRSGGAVAFGDWAKRHIKSRRGAELATAALGLLIFVDDGFNCMTVGSVMRPLTDSHRVSRAKLAYLLDATAAPVCIIAPISCWAAAVSYAVPEEYNINGFRMFLRTIPYNLYALGTLLMVFALVLLRFDYGPMRRHEQAAEKGDLFSSEDRPYTENQTPECNGTPRLSNLVIPVVTLIVCCILGMAYTGGLFDGESLVDSFANADSARGLVMGSLIAVLVTLWLYLSRGVITFRSFMEAFAAGFRSMCAPMIILILSWNLSGVTGLLGAADYIHGLVDASAASLRMAVPFFVFVVSVFLAFSTGTSWGTFTILIPIVCAVFPADSEMLVISISACLAGAVCGDHCSPVSDTTIMSSAGAGSNHINHVSTQLPYALTCAAVCAVGYLAAGVLGYATESPAAMLATPLTLALELIVLLLLRRKLEKSQG
ncbi:MAG: Na+/H+ antiporter NhaC family protein [Oscillospiraceae bacterium]|nr:Na+/H+ antiporter NhaC family protein [Oscillospiraceae bacterium]